MICPPRWLSERFAFSGIGHSIGRHGVALLLTLGCGMGPHAALAIDGRSGTVASCTGDCNDDSDVTIDELVKGVNIALGSLSVDQCQRFDCRATGQVAIECLVQAVGAALDGCPAEPTKTPTASTTAVATAPTATSTVQ